MEDDCLMIVYSQKIFLFIQEIKSAINKILSEEICVQVSRDRFLDRSRRTSYPIKIVIYNHRSMLGYFDPCFYELGFHECLMQTSKEQLHNIIRHELAHYFNFIEFGVSIPAHGSVFKTFCEAMKWPNEVSQATTCLENSGSISSIEESGILRKIQKLMALASSSNENEAEQAMIKSQELLLKHNMDSKYLSNEDDEKMVLKRIMKQKRENAKMRSIAIILETFFVSTVYRRASEFIYLEIMGTSVNVEIAEYVAGFLENELEKLWRHAQKIAHLKGTIAKNSFFLGLAKGYCTKINVLKKSYGTETANALMVIEKKLNHTKSMVYSRLSSSSRGGYHCSSSSAFGELMGKQLNINSAIKESNCSTLKQIC